MVGRLGIFGVRVVGTSRQAGSWAMKVRVGYELYRQKRHKRFQSLSPSSSLQEEEEVLLFFCSFPKIYALLLNAIVPYNNRKVVMAYI